MAGDISVEDRVKQTDWYKRASNPMTPALNNQTVRTAVEYMDETETIIGLFPTVRLVDGNLKKLPVGEARAMAIAKEDYVIVPDFPTGVAASKAVSKDIGEARSKTFNEPDNLAAGGLMSEGISEESQSLSDLLDSIGPALASSHADEKKQYKVFDNPIAQKMNDDLETAFRNKYNTIIRTPPGQAEKISDAYRKAVISIRERDPFIFDEYFLNPNTEEKLEGLNYESFSNFLSPHMKEESDKAAMSLNIPFGSEGDSNLGGRTRLLGYAVPESGEAWVSGFGLGNSSRRSKVARHEARHLIIANKAKELNISSSDFSFQNAYSNQLLLKDLSTDWPPNEYKKHGKNEEVGMQFDILNAVLSQDKETLEQMFYSEYGARIQKLKKKNTTYGEDGLPEQTEGDYSNLVRQFKEDSKNRLANAINNLPKLYDKGVFDKNLADKELITKVLHDYDKDEQGFISSLLGFEPEVQEDVKFDLRPYRQNSEELSAILALAPIAASEVSFPSGSSPKTTYKVDRKEIDNLAAGGLMANEGLALERDDGVLGPFSIKSKAENYVKELRKNENTNYDEVDNKYDAIRHIGASLALYAQYPDIAADVILKTKEYLFGAGDPRGQRMDLHNNNIGKILYEGLSEDQANALTTEEALDIATKYYEDLENMEEEKIASIPEEMLPVTYYGVTKNKKVNMESGGLMAEEYKKISMAPGGALVKNVVSTLSPTAKSLAKTAALGGTAFMAEDAEGAYIPLKAFLESGSELARALYDKAIKRIDGGADTAPNGELYNEMGVYKSEDGDFKVDIPELQAREVESILAVSNFEEDLAFFIATPVKRNISSAITNPISRYIGENSPIFKNFPDLKDAKVTLAPLKKDSGVLGEYRPRTKEIVVYVDSSMDVRGRSDAFNFEALTAFDTLIHEFQHHIQDVKNAANTGYNTTYAKSALKEITSDYFKAGNKLKKLSPTDPEYAQYKNAMDQTHILVQDSLRGSWKTNQLAKKVFASDSIDDQMEFVKEVLVTKPKVSGSIEHDIYIRELGEAEARSSGAKSLLTTKDRKRVGVFYPKEGGAANIMSTSNDLNMDNKLLNTHILVREVPLINRESLQFTSQPVAKLSEAEKKAVDADIFSPKVSSKSDVDPGKATVVGVGTSAIAANVPPSEAFVKSLGFDDYTPTGSLFDVAGGAVPNEIGITNTFLLDLLIPRTKPYDLISNIPGIGEGMMAADGIDYLFGEELRGKGSEAGQRIRTQSKQDAMKMNRGIMSDGN